MPRLNANPNVEASAAFDVVKPCTTKLRVEEISEFQSQSGNTCWKLRASFVDPTSLDKLDGSGPATLPGSLFDNGLVVAPADKQNKVRAFVEACGKPWENLDSDDLIGCEFEAKIGLEEYNGEQKNVIKRYLAPTV